MQGTVKTWWADRFYGFIVQDLGAGDIFFHGKQVLCDVGLLQRGVRVEYVMRTGSRGPEAVDVQVIGDLPEAA